jgi:hypothetical protein
LCAPSELRDVAGRPSIAVWRSLRISSK